MASILTISCNEIKIQGLHLTKFNEEHNSKEILAVDNDDKVIHIEIFNSAQSFYKNRTYTIEKINDKIENLHIIDYMFRGTNTYYL